MTPGAARGDLVRYYGSSRDLRPEVLALRITLELPPDVEKTLSIRAQVCGVSIDEYVLQLLALNARGPDVPESSQAGADNLYELFAPVRGLLTDDEIDACFRRNQSGSRALDFA